MIKEFVPYELAVKLKAIGFNEECFGAYHNENYLDLESEEYDYSYAVKAPIFSQAFRWFREKYLYHPHFFSKEDGTFVWCIRWYIDGIQKDTPYFSSNTYEEAELACLDKLIDIITKQQEQ